MQEIYHIYFGHDGREYRELGHSFQVSKDIVDTAVRLCDLGTPLGSPINRPILFSYPDSATDCLYMICCSTTNDSSNRNALFYHVLACPFSAAQRFGVNAFSLYDAGRFITNYQPGDTLDTVPFMASRLPFNFAAAPFVISWETEEKAIVIQSDQPKQLVRGLLNIETVNRLKWAEFSYHELLDFDLYVLSNPDLNSTQYVVRDAKGKLLFAQNRIESENTNNAQTQQFISGIDETYSNHLDQNLQTQKSKLGIITYVILIIAIIVSYNNFRMRSEINSLKKAIETHEQNILNLNESTKNLKETTTPKPLTVENLRELNNKVSKLNERLDKLDIKIDNEILKVKSEMKNTYTTKQEFEDSKNRGGIKSWFGQ